MSEAESPHSPSRQMKFVKICSACCLMVALVACSTSNDETATNPQHDTTATANQAVVPDSASEPFTSPEDATSARAVVARYFALLDQKNYAQALELWGDDGQKSFRSNPADLARQYERYTRFHGIPAALGSIQSGVSKDNIVVPATAEVTFRRDGTHRTLRGWVYLHRSSVSGDTDWKIRGVDIRKPLDD